MLMGPDGAAVRPPMPAAGSAPPPPPPPPKPTKGAQPLAAIAGSGVEPKSEQERSNVGQLGRSVSATRTAVEVR
jgi:hypothetical protein